MPGYQSGTNAASNAYDDTGHTAFVQPWHFARINGFHNNGSGPLSGGQKSPRYGYHPPAGGRRPAGAGWGRSQPHGGSGGHPEHRPGPSPQPRPTRGQGPFRGAEPFRGPQPQQWRHVSAPRAFYPQRGYTPPRRGR
jgi:hypothetical protein